MKNSLIPFILLFSISCAGLVSCSSQVNSTLNTWVKPQVNLLTLNEIAVLPFSSDSTKLTSVQLKSKLSTQDLEAINKKLLTELKLKTSVNIADCKPVNLAPANSTLLERAIRYGQSCGSQAVMYGLISKYGEDKYGQGKGAAFTLWLYSFRHKAVVWTASYENSQPVLTDNLFGLGGAGLEYRNSEENLFAGFKKLAVELEANRTVRKQ